MAEKPELPDYEPLEITQGESASWERSLAGYPATEWSAAYRFRGVRGVGAGINVACTASGTSFAAEITPAQSRTMSVTTYEWQLWLTRLSDASDIRQAERGTIRVNLGFTAEAAGPVDTRSAAQQVLDAIDAVIASKATADQLEYTIETTVGKRQLKRLPMTELVAARTHYAAIVARERQAERMRSRGSIFKNVYVRMRGDNDHN